MGLPEGAVALAGHGDRVDRVLPLPGKGLVVTASFDKKVRVFSAAGECLHTLSGHEAGVCGLAALGGGLVASGDSRVVGASLRVWDVESGECVSSISPGGSVWSIAALSDTRFVASARGDLVFYSHVQGKGLLETQRIAKAHSDVIFDIGVCGDVMVTASRDEKCTVAVWSTATCESLGVLRRHKKPVRTVSVNEDRIVTAALDGKIRLFDAKTLELKRVIKGTHTKPIYCVRLLPGGMMLSASWDGTVCVSHPVSGAILARVEMPFQVWAAAALSPDTFVASGASEDALLFKVPGLDAQEARAEEALKRNPMPSPNDEPEPEEPAPANPDSLALTIRVTIRDILAKILNRATLAIDQLSAETLWPMQRIRRRFDF